MFNLSLPVGVFFFSILGSLFHELRTVKNDSSNRSTIARSIATDSSENRRRSWSLSSSTVKPRKSAAYANVFRMDRARL